MEFDGQNIMIEFLDEAKDDLFPVIVEEECNSDTSFNTTRSATEFDMGDVLDENVLNASEVENLINEVNIEALDDVAKTFNEMELNINPDDIIEETYEEFIVETFKVPKIHNKLPETTRNLEEDVETENVPYICDTCSLDFPSKPYFIRHNRTKKHKRALDMERRGKKVNQKRKYVRKNSCKTRTVQVVPTNQLMQGAKLLQNSELVQRIQPVRNVQNIRNAQTMRPVLTMRPVQNIKPVQTFRPIQTFRPVQNTGPFQIQSIEIIKPFQAVEPIQAVQQIQITPTDEQYIEVQEPSFGDLNDIQVTNFMTENDQNVSLKNFYENIDIDFDFDGCDDIGDKLGD